MVEDETSDLLGLQASNAVAGPELREEPGPTRLRGRTVFVAFAQLSNPRPKSSMIAPPKRASVRNGAAVPNRSNIGRIDRSYLGFGIKTQPFATDVVQDCSVSDAYQVNGVFRCRIIESWCQGGRKERPFSNHTRRPNAGDGLSRSYELHLWTITEEPKRAKKPAATCRRFLSRLRRTVIRSWLTRSSTA